MLRTPVLYQIVKPFDHINLQLCFTVDEQKLRDVFRLAGRIVSVEVSKDRDGKSRGYGLVEYTHPVEAVQAISMFSNQKVINAFVNETDLINSKTKNTLSPLSGHSLTGHSLSGQNLFPIIRTSVKRTKQCLVRIT